MLLDQTDISVVMYLIGNDTNNGAVTNVLTTEPILYGILKLC